MLRQIQLHLILALMALIIIALPALSCSRRPPDAFPHLLFRQSFAADSASLLAGVAEMGGDASSQGGRLLHLAETAQETWPLPRGLTMASYAASVTLLGALPGDEGTALSLGFSWRAANGDFEEASLDVLSNGSVMLRTPGSAGPLWETMEIGKTYAFNLVVNLSERRVAAWIDDEFIAETLLENAPSRNRPDMKLFRTEALMSEARAAAGELAAYRGLLMPLTRLRNCVTGEPHKSGDVVNLVFEGADSLEKTLARFADAIPWTVQTGKKLCLENDDGSLIPQGADRASQASNRDRWHVRFYQDEENRRTLAAAHRDVCGARGVGERCRPFQSHQGTAFFEARDLVMRLFSEAGYETSLVGVVGHIALGD